MKEVLIPSLMIVLLTAVSACGQKGSLYHPTQEEQQKAAEKKQDLP